MPRCSAIWFERGTGPAGDLPFPTHQSDGYGGGSGLDRPKVGNPRVRIDDGVAHDIRRDCDHRAPLLFASMKISSARPCTALTLWKADPQGHGSFEQFEKIVHPVARHGFGGAK